MSVDLTEFRAAVAALDAAIVEIADRQAAHRLAFHSSGDFASHERYYELRGRSPASWADRDKWMAENYPEEHARAERIQADAKTFLDEQAKRQDGLKPHLEKALAILGREFGREFVLETAGNGATLDDIEDAFIRMNEVLQSEFKTLEQIPMTLPDYEGPCSLAFYRELAPVFDVVPTSRDVINRVRQEMTSVMRLHS